MNGWIETNNPGLFSQVSDTDVILRSSTTGGNVVLGNGSKFIAGMYVSSNLVGVRGVPSGDHALEVIGGSFAVVPPPPPDSACDGRSVVIDHDRLVMTFSSNARFTVDRDCVDVRHQTLVAGKVDAHSVSSAAFFKTGDEFEIRIVRVYNPSSYDIDVEGLSTKTVQDLVGRTVSIGPSLVTIESVEQFGKSHHLGIRPYSYHHHHHPHGGLKPFALGPARMTVVDTSLMTLDKLGPIRSRSQGVETPLITNSAKVYHASCDGRQVLEIGLRRAPTTLAENALVRLKVTGASPRDNELNLFRVVRSADLAVVLALFDNVGEVADAYPSIVNELVGRVGVSVVIASVRSTERRETLLGAQVSFQTNKVVVDFNQREALKDYVVSAMDVDLGGGESTVRVVPVGQQVIAAAASSMQTRVVFNTMAKSLGLMFTGASRSVSVLLSGAPFRILRARPLPPTTSINLLQIALAASVRVAYDDLSAGIASIVASSSSSSSAYVVIRRADGVSRTWRLRDFDCRPNDGEISLSVDDEDEQCDYGADETVHVLAYRPETIVALAVDRTIDAVVLDRPLGVNVSGAGRVRAGSALSVGGPVDAASVVLLDAEGGAAATLSVDAEGRAQLSADHVRIRADDMDASGTSASFADVDASGGAVLCDDLVAGCVLTVLSRTALPPDPTRAPKNAYDYDVGETIASFESSAVDVPDGADSAYVTDDDGRRAKFSVKSSSSSSHHPSSSSTHVQFWTPDLAAVGALDLAGRLRVTFCSGGGGQRPHTSSSFSLDVVSISDDGYGKYDLTVDAIGEMIQYVGRTVSVGKVSDKAPKNAFLVEAVDPVGSAGTRAELQLVAGDAPDWGTGDRLEVRALETPFSIDLRETLEDVSFATGMDGSHRMSFRPSGARSFFFSMLPPGVLDTNGRSCVGSITIKDAVVRPTSGPVRNGNRVELVVADDMSTAMVASCSRIVSRIVLNGAPLELVGRAKAVGLHGAEVAVNSVSSQGTLRKLRDRRRDDGAAEATLFVQGRPWRLASIVDVDRYTAVLSLKRLEPPLAGEDLLDLRSGSIVYVLPVSVGGSRSISCDIVRAGVVTVGSTEGLETIVRNDNGRMILEESLMLSAREPYSRFRKNLHVQGCLVAETISHVSDRVFKTDIRDRDPAVDLAIVRDIRLHEYMFLDRDGPRAEFGVIADELERVLPEAVAQVEGFVPDIRAKATYNRSGFLVIAGLFESVIARSLRLQVRSTSSPNSSWVEVRAGLCYESDGTTYVGLEQDERLDVGDYDVYGTWGTYKVASTTHLLLCCLNAIKALRGTSSP